MTINEILNEPCSEGSWVDILSKEVKRLRKELQNAEMAADVNYEEYKKEVEHTEVVEAEVRRWREIASKYTERYFNTLQRAETAEKELKVKWYCIPHTEKFNQEINQLAKCPWCALEAAKAEVKRLQETLDAVNLLLVKDTLVLRDMVRIETERDHYRRVLEYYLSLCEEEPWSDLFREALKEKR